MPKVGDDNYPYTLKGMKDAQEHSKRSGKPVEITEYGGGGHVPKYMNGGRVMQGSPNRMMPRPKPKAPLFRSNMGTDAADTRLSQAMRGLGQVLSKYGKGGKVNKRKGAKK